MQQTKVQPHSYYIWTIGCQMNKADSERLANALDNLGLVECGAPKEADVIILNSCVVRQSAEDKVIGMLSSLKPLKMLDPHRILALMGCMVEPQAKGLQRRFPYVDVFMRPQQYDPLIDLLGDRMDIDVDGCLKDLSPLKPHVTTYVPVIHGCNEFCSFCIIPYRRGRQRSRSLEDVTSEVRLLVQRGVKEVTLLGQTVDAYGHDLPDKPDLADLMAQIHDVEGLERIRFLTSHPRYMSERIIRTIAELPKICEHINLPFQAGDDQVLLDMRRTYNSDYYRRLVDRIRSTIPSVSMSTDVIVGFPGETESQFHATIDILQDLKFDKVHVAAYSPRPGTIAIRKMADDVSVEDKKARLQAVEDVQEQISASLNARLLGETIEVLVDGHHKGQWQGRTRTDKLVFFQSDAHLIGQLLDVHIEKTGPWSLQGTLQADRLKVNEVII